jgi:hypothetical protein
MTEHELDIERRLTAIEAKYERTVEDLEKVSNQLSIITSKLDKYEGKWGGVIMVMSAVTALMAVFWKSIHEVLFGH